MITIKQGDWIEQLKLLPDNSAHCSVTSPPYFGLRNYGVDGQAGLEKTPEEYIAGMVAGFRELRRVLREDGVLWLNLGDSYVANRGNTNKAPGFDNKAASGHANLLIRDFKIPGKSKDLIGIPHRVAFALQADGWYLRAICPWLKRNGMPESCRDRPTQTIEYIFLLTKSAKYFYDAEAVKLAGVVPAGTKGAKGSAERAGQEGVNSRPCEYKVCDGTRLRRTSDWFFESGLLHSDEGDPLAFVVNTAAYKKAHFATFPPKLIEPCILAGTSEHGCCAKCGAPWERVVNRTPMVIDRLERTHELGRTRSSGTMVSPASSETLGWQASCKCGVDVVPCTVLDPFGGSGTTGQVAKQHGRDAILIELNPAYISLIEERTAA